VCHFGVRREITVDNGKQFDSDLFKEFCHQIRIKIAFASVYHPQSNGAVEKTNGIIFTSVKKRVEGGKKGKWAEELPKAVWSHNTTVSRATKFTPFKLLFGEEAVTLEELKHRSPHTNIKAQPIVSEKDSKDILEPEKLKAIQNLQKY